MDFLSRKVLPLLGIGSLVLGGCGDDDDGGGMDAGGDDAGGLDSGGMDAAMPDAGSDAGTDAGSDAGMPDTGPMVDATVPDANAGVDTSAFATALCSFYVMCDDSFEYTLEECSAEYTSYYDTFVNMQVLADGPDCATALQGYLDCLVTVYDTARDGTCMLPDEYCVEEYAPVETNCPTNLDEE